MSVLLNLYCPHCLRYEWHVLNYPLVYRCLGCIARGEDRHINIAASQRIIAT